jgi:hypothetical protein
MAAGLLLGAASAHSQSASDVVGRIEGDSVSVRGEVHVTREGGHTYTSLSSGSQVTVRSGRAHIELVGGGEIGVCGPARFSLVRAGSSLTLALDYGRVRARVIRASDLRVYTPMVVATPVAAAGHPDDVSVGLEEGGKMCVRTGAGALRLEPQFGGDAVVVPQSMEATLADGQLSSLAGTAQACGCDALDVRYTQETQQAHMQAQVPLPPARSALPAQEPEKKSPEPPQKPPESASTEQPIWKVYMPPLSFDAANPNPDAAPAKGKPPSAETITVFRDVLVEPVITLHGQVETPPEVAKNSNPPPPLAPRSDAPAVQPERKPSFGARVKNFFRRLFGGKPKQDQPVPPQGSPA